MKEIKEPLTKTQKLLVEKNYGLAVWTAQRLHKKIPLTDIEDIISDCLIFMVKASRRFDSKKGKFTTYAVVSMRKMFWSKYFKERTRQERIRSTYSERDKVRPKSKIKTPLECTIQAEEPERVEKLLRSVHSLKDRDALRRQLLYGETNIVIARRDYVTRQAVSSRIQRAIEELKVQKPRLQSLLT